MKVRKIKSLIYIFSSVMILGLALLSFEHTPKTKQTTTVPNITVEKPTTPTPVVTLTSTPTPSPTSTPSPTPTPSVAQINAAIPIQPATDDTGIMLTEQIASYLNEFYSDEDMNVKEITNLTCYYKEGLSSADYFVYAVYDIHYLGSNVLIPALDEYCVSIDGTEITVSANPQDDDISEALLLSRASESVSELYIQETIRCYMNAKLACDELLLSELVTDSTHINIASITTETQYYEEYRNLNYLIHACPDSIAEFDYIVFTTTDIKLINVSTLAPGGYRYIIKLDENNYPKIFFGSVSESSNAYITKFCETEEYLNIYSDVTKRFEEAIKTDPDLAKIMEVIFNTTGSE